MKGHANLAFFIPHLGCPNQCSFCDQRVISGAVQAPSPEAVAAQCRACLASGKGGSHTEIAFFGGSFTAIPKKEMISYLEAVQPFLGNGGFAGIRISTRPDAVPEEILQVLKAYHVTAVELGAQSMSDTVLEKNQRGHTMQDVRDAALRIRSYGFSLGLQMMYGLYGSTEADEQETLNACIGLKPDTMRLYPTVILEGTRLAELYRKGAYILPSWDAMLSFVGEAICRLRQANIALIRCGLHAEEHLEKRMLGGFYHPALRELAEERLYLRAMMDWLRMHPELIPSSRKDFLLAEVHPGCAGLAAGHNKANRRRISESTSGMRMKIAEEKQLPEGFLRMSLCCLQDDGTIKRLGEEVYDVFKITGTTGL